MDYDAWELDCMKWRRAILKGRKRHWCDDWDGLPIDETTAEWPCNCRIRDDYDAGPYPAPPSLDPDGKEPSP